MEMCVGAVQFCRNLWPAALWLAREQFIWWDVPTCSRLDSAAPPDGTKPFMNITGQDRTKPADLAVSC